MVREKVIGLSDANVCRDKLLRGIAKSTLVALDSFNMEKQRIPLVYIQEIASFITVMCTCLNEDISREGKEPLTKHKKRNFF